MLEKGLRPTAKAFALIFVFLQLLALYFLSSSSAAAYGAPRPQEHSHEALGSLDTVGEVLVNGAAAAAQSTIFAGDVLRSGGTGSATFTLSGKGSFQIYPNAEIIFTGEPQYAAELKLGKVVMNSWNGATGINLRAGSAVVVAVAEGEQSISNIEAPSDGSFLVTCVGGSVGVIPLQGGKGIFVRAGQAVGISAQGEFSITSAPPARSAVPASADRAETLPAARQKHSRTRWILAGVVAAGAGTAAAILLSANGSGTPSAVSSDSSGSSSKNPPAPDPPPPSNPAPQPPPPPPPPPPPGNGCQGHHTKNCRPHVVIGFAFHF